MPINGKLDPPPREKNHVAVIADAAEAKVKAVETLAQKKTQALMRTIDRLNKENLELKRQSQDHRRSATFKKLETEMGKQDAIIMCLQHELKMMHGDSYVQKCVTEVLARGPPRIPTKTRQELIQENKKLHIKVKALNIKETTVAPPKEEKPREEEEDEREKILNTQKEKIDALQQENTSLKVELESQGKCLEQQDKQLLESQQKKGTKEFDRERAQFENKMHLLENEIRRLKETNENLKRQSESDATLVNALHKEKLNEMQRMKEIEDRHEENLEKQSIELNGKLDMTNKRHDEKVRVNEELTAKNKTMTALAEAAKKNEVDAQDRISQQQILNEQTRRQLQEEIDAERDEVRNLRTTNASIAKAHEDALTELREAHAKVERLDHCIGDLDRARDENEKEREALIAQMEGHKDCEDVRAECETLRKQYGGAQKKLKELEEQLTKQPVEDDVPAVADGAPRTCVSCRRNKLEVEQMQNKLAETKQDCERRLKEQPRSERLEKLEAEKQALEEENDTLNEKVKKLNKNKVMTQIYMKKSRIADDDD
eukprot:GEMP01029259.1.p1 GENE.GEMP01029259.1~~GEMP01029259.1.p1  ORF type:complete len:545 (+),score=174.44 GEMP01029259.1:174-1808(+)